MKTEIDRQIDREKEGKRYREKEDQGEGIDTQTEKKILLYMIQGIPNTRRDSNKKVEPIDMKEKSRYITWTSGRETGRKIKIMRRGE